jgi:hypothetical protein
MGRPRRGSVCPPIDERVAAARERVEEGSELNGFDAP